MHTPEGDKLAPHDPVTVRAEYLAPHPVGGGRVVLTTLDGHPFDVPIDATRLVRIEPPQWGGRARADEHPARELLRAVPAVEHRAHLDAAVRE